MWAPIGRIGDRAIGKYKRDVWLKGYFNNFYIVWKHFSWHVSFYLATYAHGRTSPCNYCKFAMRRATKIVCLDCIDITRRARFARNYAFFIATLL